MGVILCKEVTTLGDSCGIDTEKVGLRETSALSATRKFIVQLSTDSSPSAYATELLLALPVRGSVHPSITACYVDNISCVATDDPYVYEATVNYKWSQNTTDVTPDPQNPETSDINLPWLQPATLAFGTDTGITRAMDKAYGCLGARYAVSITPAVIQSLNVEDIADDKDLFGRTYNNGTGASLTVPLVIRPLNEQPMNLPEEPVGGVTLTLSASIKGEDATSPETHDFAIIQDLLALAHTVYAVRDAETVFDIRGYEIKRYCGYISNINIENLWYYSQVCKKNYAYYKVTVTIIDNPETWVRSVLNLSYNYLSSGDPRKLTKIRVKDDKSQLEELPDKPLFIDVTSGLPIGVNVANGFLQEDTNNREHAVMYLTKRISEWVALDEFIEGLEWNAPQV
jgi:peroxiredoxin